MTVTDGQQVDAAEQVLALAGKVVPMLDDPDRVALLAQVLEGTLGGCDSCHLSDYIYKYLHFRLL